MYLHVILFIDTTINYFSSAMDKNRQPKPKSCNFLPQWALSWGKCKAEVLYRVYMFLKPLPTEKTGQLADNNEFDSIFKILKIELKLKHICHSKPKDVRWIWMTMSGKFDRRLTYLNGSLQIWRLPVTVKTLCSSIFRNLIKLDSQYWEKPAIFRHNGNLLV